MSNTKVSAVQMLTAMESQLEQAIPDGGPRANQYVRAMVSLLKKNETLRQCTPTSIQNVALEVAQLGLLPDNTLGQAYVLPFRNNDKGVMEATYILGYRGMIELCVRGGNVAKVEPRCVFEGDQFSYEYGLDPKLRHVPALEGESNRMLTHTYVIWYYRDRVVAPSFYVMGRKAIEAVKKRSKSKGFSPWKTDYDAMAMKSVIRNSAKYQSVSIQALHAIQRDEEQDIGLGAKDAGTFRSSNVATDDLDDIFGASTGEQEVQDEKGKPITDDDGKPIQGGFE